MPHRYAAILSAALLAACATSSEMRPGAPDRAAAELTEDAKAAQEVLVETFHDDEADASDLLNASEKARLTGLRARKALAESIPASDAFEPDQRFKLCYRRVRHAPATNQDRYIVNYRPFVRVENAVTLAVKPVKGACLTSSFGPRGRRVHKGVDMQSRPARMVHAPAAGVIVEAHYRYDYGYQIVIDHGAGVYTRLAHLARFQPGIKRGAKVKFGAPLGMMGNSSNDVIGIHLHYEVLLGDYDNPKKSFGLTAKSVFSFPYIEPLIAAAPKDRRQG